MEKVLFINTCDRAQSRTMGLARLLLKRLGGRVEKVDLYRHPPAILGREELERRSELLALGEYDAPQFRYAHQFAAADVIVIAAPYWDLSFPAQLRTYLEQVTVAGITFRYSYYGAPVGMCQARRLYYVTTASGPIGKRNLGFQYVKTLADNFYGICKSHCFSAENLDMPEADIAAILAAARAEIESYPL